ncbi:SRPBCC family protein [Mobilicoccus caccae]|uniref:Polyketide cyclase n=1 Tax=Mobilicoccus caccae TaxID=1859295 RepID=A0ABQ6IWR1_9MICO|nr:SRPBCC family protein [Mobilicoccus caccae]GMA42026.1 polyketide cyclase [Mobilicoccus caccae]
MSTTERRTNAAPEAIWDVIADGWTFVAWVVGASRVRAVEPDWPAVGSRIHHSVGAWPAVIDDNTQVLEVEDGRRIVMEARIRPAGQARVDISLIPDGTGTVIRMVEDFTSGPATKAPKPARDAALHVRNVETLKRLALLAERREHP